MQKSVKKKVVYTRNLLLYNVQKRRLSPDNQIFSFNLKSNTMKNTMQKYCFLTI